MSPSEIFPILIDLLESWRRSRGAPRPELREAVDAVRLALQHTERYSRVAASDRDIAVEHHLADLWGRAAIALRHENSEFARIAAMKMDYWSRPGAWTEEAVLSAGIGIPEVIDRYEELQREL